MSKLRQTIPFVLVLLTSARASGQEILWQWDGENDIDFFGMRLSSAGDWDRDGFPDLLVGAIRFGNNAGRAYLFSGQTGQRLRRWTGQDDENVGASLRSLGDVDGDGWVEIAVGANGADSPAGNLGAGRVRVHSSSTGGSEVYSLHGEFPNISFGVPCTSADLDGDGILELITSATLWTQFSPHFNKGKVYVFSSTNGEEQFTLFGEGEDHSFGRAIGNAGDVDADGCDDLIVSARLDNVINDGRGRVYSLLRQNSVVAVHA